MNNEKCAEGIMKLIGNRDLREQLCYNCREQLCYNCRVREYSKSDEVTRI